VGIGLVADRDVDQIDQRPTDIAMKIERDAQPPVADDTANISQ